MRSLPLSALLIGAALAAGPARALDERGAQAVIDKFVKAQKLDEGDPSPGRHVIADLDGDGRQDLVLQWDVLGANTSWPKLTVFIDQGRSWRVLTTDLSGQIENITVSGSTIRVDALMPGPKDPRCCPTRKTRTSYRWANGRLGRVP